MFRRWRHLLVFAFCVFFVEIVSGLISGALSRPRPYGVPVIGRWEGYSAPSPAVMTATFLLVAGVYCLIVPGRPRSVAKAAVAAVVTLFCLSRLYLAVDHPDDVLSGIVLGVAIPVAAFRFFTPNELFPVVYRRGRTAHVDVTGVRSARPYGIVEITPEREYLLVTEFFSGAVELGEAEVDDGLIDQELLLIRKLWDASLAHRDIKPGNLMVRDGELLLIDAAFAQVRPSPWRQAVDLGNMMLVLAVRTDAERVYRRALDYFTPDELAEAFAATRGVASPTQLRAFMKRDPRDLLAEFRALAPPRRPIGLQRWGARRVIVAAALLGAALLAADLAVDAFHPTPNTVTAAPFCGTGHSMILSAQAVPSSAMLPCIARVLAP